MYSRALSKGCCAGSRFLDCLVIEDPGVCCKAAGRERALIFYRIVSKQSHIHFSKPSLTMLPYCCVAVVMVKSDIKFPRCPRDGDPKVDELAV